MSQFDLIVIGGGPAGYICAIRAAQLGLATAVVEKEKLGGVCVNIGCIPTKALLHSAYALHLIQHDAKALGIEVGQVKADYGIAMKRSRQVSDQNSRGVEFLMKKHKITVLKGAGVLQPGRKVKVGNEVHEARKAVVIATGSRVKGIPAIGLEINKTSVISSDEALFLEKVPATLAIVGAGAVGSEFADIFSAFGTKVTLIEALPRILPLEDPESSDTITKSFKKRGIDGPGRRQGQEGHGHRPAGGARGRSRWQSRDHHGREGADGGGPGGEYRGDRASRRAESSSPSGDSCR